MNEERLRQVAERSRRACLANSAPAWVLLRLVGAPVEDLERASQKLLGYAPACPEGGKYRLDPEIDQVVCSQHGSPDRPRQGIEGTTLPSLERLEEVSVSMSFTEEGLATRLEVDVAPKPAE